MTYIFTFQSGDIQIPAVVKSGNQVLIFTFQSGDIQMFKFKVFDFLSNIFTFQSGDIQIWLWCTWIQKKINLHSNLVIFKCYKVYSQISFIINLHSNLVIFKFAHISFLSLIPNIFTFQSGDIQISSMCSSYSCL